MNGDPCCNSTKNRVKVLVEREVTPRLPISENAEQIKMILQLRSHHLGIVAVYDREIERLRGK